MTSDGRPKQIRSSGKFTLQDLDLVASTFSQSDTIRGSPWDDFRDACLELPDWFDATLDPYSDAYRQQQHRIWSTITASSRGYNAERDELPDRVTDADAIRFPGFYSRRDPDAVQAAANHIIATGVILKHSELRPGDWALEYGAGFAQTAVQLARLGVNVDTVDISADFCRHVGSQAGFFGIPLTPFEGRFGFDPRSGKQPYDLVWFYESFHHCEDFTQVVGQLAGLLSSRGRILMAGEPIVRAKNADIPYPWGIRLSAENVAVVRNMRWFELGFTEDFLVGLFLNAGFEASRIDCPLTSYGEGYVFTRRGPCVPLSNPFMPTDMTAGWHLPEAGGRWSRERSWLELDTTPSFDSLSVTITNHHPVRHRVQLAYGVQDLKLDLGAGQRRQVRFDAASKASRLVFSTSALVPARDYGPSDLVDERALGIFVNEVAYI